MNFKEVMNAWIDRVNDTLDSYVKEKDTPEKNIYTAMRYSLLAGGKRLRPVLALAVCDMLGGKDEGVMPYACAIEMIHTYSLIHDDLPAMDNDDYRRGRLTNHKVYGEAQAILAGDALLNYAFEIMLMDLKESNNGLMQKIAAMDTIACASGVSGMIGGQVVDLEWEGKEVPSHILEYMHRCKTGALIKAPVLAAAKLCNASDKEFEALKIFAENLGLAFQIKDDILDVIGDLNVMGKKSGNDAANGKSTYVTLYGLQKAEELLKSTTDNAMSAIEIFGEKAWFLKELAEYLIARDK